MMLDGKLRDKEMNDAKKRFMEIEDVNLLRRLKKIKLKDFYLWL